MTKQNFLCITDHHIFIDHIFCLTIHIYFSLKNILKNHPASWHWMMNFYRCRLWIPQNILQILQCILWSTQDRTYNCTVHLMKHTRQDIQLYSASYGAHKTGHTIVQCILWSTQDRTYNSAGDQKITDCCLYCWHIPIILAHVFCTEQNSTAHPVSFMIPRYNWITYATANEDLPTISMVTYRTHVPARMSVLWEVLFEKECA